MKKRKGSSRKQRKQDIAKRGIVKVKISEHGSRPRRNMKEIKEKSGLRKPRLRQTLE